MFSIFNAFARSDLLGYQGPLLQVPGVGREVRAKVGLPAHVAIGEEGVFGARVMARVQAWAESIGVRAIGR